MDKKRKKEIIRYVASKLAWLLILAFGKMSRLVVKNETLRKKALSSGRPLLYVAWHGKMLAPIYVLRNKKIIAMVSEHGDGEIIAQTIVRLGYKTIRGSSTRGGSKAFREMYRELKNGRHCTMLPDGPTGPSRVMKMGAVQLAQRTEGLLLPITFAAERPIIMKSWDGFTLWRPFSKVVVVYGRPIHVPRKLSPEQLESFRIKIENIMNDQQRETDELFRK